MQLRLPAASRRGQRGRSALQAVLRLRRRAGGVAGRRGAVSGRVRAALLCRAHLSLGDLRAQLLHLHCRPRHCSRRAAERLVLAPAAGGAVDRHFAPPAGRLGSGGGRRRGQGARGDQFGAARRPREWCTALPQGVEPWPLVRPRRPLSPARAHTHAKGVRRRRRRHSGRGRVGPRHGRCASLRQATRQGAEGCPGRAVVS
mmetsp:Transcript_8818/g.27819  ORF Transcript_8818/g.27819 Transcript_8818/m.27819 type:complete len:201 (-) Transcript_8818:65-667(-)